MHTGYVAEDGRYQTPGVRLLAQRSRQLPIGAFQNQCDQSRVGRRGHHGALLTLTVKVPQVFGTIYTQVVANHLEQLLNGSAGGF